MYAVGNTLPIEQFDAGTFLLAGPAMSGKYELLLDILAEGCARGEGALVVTTNRDAASIISDFETRIGEHPSTLRIVDAVSERQGSRQEVPSGMVEHVSSPADLTGIGIAVSEQLQALSEADVELTRVGFHSLSTLLMYTDVESTFRFLHVLTGRISSIGGLGVFVIDPTTHDESTVNTLKQLFDGMIELRNGDEGREVRVLGVPNVATDWQLQP